MLPYRAHNTRTRPRSCAPKGGGAVGRGRGRGEEGPEVTRLHPTCWVLHARKEQRRHAGHVGFVDVDARRVQQGLYNLQVPTHSGGWHTRNQQQAAMSSNATSNAHPRTTSEPHVQPRPPPHTHRRCAVLHAPNKHCLVQPRHAAPVNGVDLPREVGGVVRGRGGRRGVRWRAVFLPQRVKRGRPWAHRGGPRATHTHAHPFPQQKRAVRRPNAAPRWRGHLVAGGPQAQASARAHGHTGRSTVPTTRGERAAPVGATAAPQLLQITAGGSRAYHDAGARKIKRALTSDGSCGSRMYLEMGGGRSDPSSPPCAWP
jgi:hypothetical protein